MQGRFLAYWQQHGGLTQFGYPLTEELSEPSPVDQKVYVTQYFARAMFEYHSEDQPPNDILITLLGVQSYKQKYPNGTPNQYVSQDNPYTFAATGKTLSGKFRTY